MRNTQEVMGLLNISRQWLHQVAKTLKIKPKQKIEGGKVKNYFTADQVRKMRLTVGS